MSKAERVLERYNFRTASPLSVGETVENGLVRVHRYRDVIEIHDLTNAGKRGKRVEKLYINRVFSAGSTTEDWYSLLSTIGSELERCRSIDQVKRVLGGYEGRVDVSTYFERGVDVTPAGFKEIKIHTPHVYIEVGYKDFTVRDLEDRFNEPTCIPAVKGGLRGIPVFYRWVQDNASAIKNMSFHEIMEQMSALGIPSHYFCAMD